MLIWKKNQFYFQMVKLVKNHQVYMHESTMSRLKTYERQQPGCMDTDGAPVHQGAGKEHTGFLGLVLLLRHDTVARILANGSAAFFESCAAIGWKDRDSVRCCSETGPWVPDKGSMDLQILDPRITEAIFCRFLYNVLSSKSY